MNRYEANRQAKTMYCMMGEYYLAWTDEDWDEYRSDNFWNEKDIAMVRDYYKRTADRVAEWLGM